MLELSPRRGDRDASSKVLQVEALAFPQKAREWQPESLPRRPEKYVSDCARRSVTLVQSNRGGRRCVGTAIVTIA